MAQQRRSELSKYIRISIQARLAQTAPILTPPVLKLMPPILADNLVFLDLVNGPSLLVFLVQEDGLEDVVLDRPLCILQLVLEV